MKKIMKRLLTGVLSLAAVFTTLHVSQVQAAEKQYCTGLSTLFRQLF